MVRSAIVTISLLFLWRGLVFGQSSQEARLHADNGLKLMRDGDLPAAEVELREAVKLSPRDPTYLAELGVVLGMEQKFADSDLYFQEALRFDPGNASVRRNLAKNQWRLGEFESAEANLQEVLKAQPGDGESALILGMVEEDLKHFVAAVRLLDSVPSLIKQHPESMDALAQSYYELKNRPAARQTLRGLLQVNAPPDALYLGGQTALQAEDYSMAEELLAAAQPGYPDHAKLGYFLALSRYRVGKFSECQQTIFDTLAAAPASRELCALLGWCFAQQDKIRQSINAFDQAIELAPTDETAYLDLGTVLLDRHRDELAVLLGKETTAKFPNSYRAKMLLGTAQGNFGYLTDALASFHRAVELNPQSPEANFNLAMIQLAAGFADDALATLERGIKKLPDDAQHYQEYASFQVERAEGGDAGAEARAYDALHRAISLDNGLAKSHLLLGRLELKNNRVERAVSELDTAAKLDPKDGLTHLLLSRAYTRLGKPDQTAKEAAIYKNSAQAEVRSGRLRTRSTLRRW
jgi:Flp pilus assembly protein TadD